MFTFSILDPAHLAYETRLAVLHFSDRFHTCGGGKGKEENKLEANGGRGGRLDVPQLGQQCSQNARTGNGRLESGILPHSHSPVGKKRAEILRNFVGFCRYRVAEVHTHMHLHH